MSTTFIRSMIAAASFALAASALAQNPPPQPNPAAAQQGAQQGAQQQGPGQGQQPRRPRPYNQVITNRAVSDPGGITVHRVDDRWFFEVPDSLARRDFLFVTRIAGVPANFGGFTSAGTSVERPPVGFEG